MADLQKYLNRAVASQKAIPDLPYLHNINEQITLGDPTAARGGRSVVRRTSLSQREAARHLQAYGGAEAIDWVMDCVSLIAETAANATYHFERDDGETVEQPDELLERLIERPNPYQDYVELFELLVIDLLLVGNAYWLKWKADESGRPLAIYRLAPPYVTVNPGPFGVDGYTYKVPGQQEPLEIDPQSVVHFKRPNPHNPYLGLGVIQGGARMMDTEIALTDTQATYYENEARYSGVVQSERPVPDSTFRKITRQLKNRSGPNSSGELLVLEAGLKYQSISPNAVDAAFEQISNLSRDRICAMFRTPLALLGIVNNANLKIADAQRVFDTKTMRPLLNRLQACISYGVVEAWGLSFKIDYDYVMPPEEKLKLASVFSSLPGIMIDEARDYAGLPPHPDKTIGELTINLPGEDGAPGDERPGPADPNLVGEAGRPPSWRNTRAIPGGGGPLPPGAAARRLKAGSDAKAVDPEVALERLEEIIDAEAWEVAPEDAKALPAAALEVPEDLLAERGLAQVDAIAAEARAEIRDAIHDLERGLLDAAEGKAGGIRARIMAAPAWRRFSQRLSDILERAAQRGVSAGALHEGSRRGDPVDVDVERLAREVVYRPEGVRGIIANLRRQVSTRVQRAEQRDADPAEIERVIREGMDYWRDGHDETVSLTEATEAYNEGAISAAEAAGSTHVFVYDGDDFDEPCIEANGSLWTIERARANRTEHTRCRRRFLGAEAA